MAAPGTRKDLDGVHRGSIHVRIAFQKYTQHYGSKILNIPVTISDVHCTSSFPG